MLKKSVKKNQLEDICSIRKLNWGNLKDEEGIGLDYGKFDVVIGADIMYFRMISLGFKLEFYMSLDTSQNPLNLF